MKYFISIFLICHLVIKSFAQPTIEGVVLDDLGEPLIGTSIVEINTENVTVSDLDGKFKLQLKSDTSKIAVQFVGCLTQEIVVQSDTSVIINMQVDASALGDEIMLQICYFESNVTSIGINGGLLNEQFGFEVQNIFPYISPIRLNLNADVKWRFSNKDNYFNLRLRRYDLFDIRNKLYFGLRAEYKSILQSDNINKIYSISPEFAFAGYSISIGFARRLLEIEEVNSSNNGVNFEIQKSILGSLMLYAGAINWKNDWQYTLRLYEDIPKIPLVLGIGWEQLNGWQEFDISVLYRFRY